jgi:acyl-CoA reductase-like NAD-dependent aldehyde dehydrogenase
VANDTEFGLSSSIFTNDAARIFRFVDEIETGMTHINSPTTGGEAHIPSAGSRARASATASKVDGARLLY